MVRNTPVLTNISAPGYYPRDDNPAFCPETDGNTIILLPKRNPVPLCNVQIKLEFEKEYHGKLQFRFSDLELSIPFTNEIRLARVYNERAGKIEWEKRHNRGYVPDIVFEFLPDGKNTMDFASAQFFRFERHNSVFKGPYEAPGKGYKKISTLMNMTGSNIPMVFSFPYFLQEKKQGASREIQCYGVLNHYYYSEDKKRLMLNFLLNLKGEANLEQDFSAGNVRHPGGKLWKKKLSFSPDDLLPKVKPLKPEIKMQYELQSEDAAIAFFGYKINKGLKLNSIRVSQKSPPNNVYWIYPVAEPNQLECRPELRDVNSDGCPDIIIHENCHHNNHRRQIYLALKSKINGKLLGFQTFPTFVQGVKERYEYLE